jgi:hypothetical protein
MEERVGKPMQSEWNLMGTLVAHHGNVRTKDGNILIILNFMVFF